MDASHAATAEIPDGLGIKCCPCWTLLYTIQSFAFRNSRKPGLWQRSFKGGLLGTACPNLLRCRHGRPKLGDKPTGECSELRAISRLPLTSGRALRGSRTAEMLHVAVQLAARTRHAATREEVQTSVDWTVPRPSTTARRSFSPRARRLRPSK